MSDPLNHEFQSMAANSICHAAQMAGAAWQEAGYEYTRPSVVFKPKLSRDGNQWCALYGENIQEGVAGFGASPQAAMYAFDDAWRKELS